MRLRDLGNQEHIEKEIRRVFGDFPHLMNVEEAIRAQVWFDVESKLDACIHSQLLSLLDRGLLQKVNQTVDYQVNVLVGIPVTLNINRGMNERFSR